MEFDEESPPDVDAPVVEPPPSAAALRAVFEQAMPPRTVVRAPLHAAEPDPDPPTEPLTDAVDTAEETARVVEPASDAAFAALRAAADEEDEDDEEDEEDGAPALAVVAVPTAPDADGLRFCAMCDMRVPPDASGERCHVGHRISPAHARKRRRWRR